MSEARAEIRKIAALARHSQACDGGYSIVGGVAADAVLNALDRAGYRIAGPEERVIGKGDMQVIESGFRSAVHFVRNVAMDMERDYPEIVAAEDAIRNLGEKA